MHRLGWLPILLVSTVTFAQNEFIEAVKDGELLLDFRYRYGVIEEDGFEEDAYPSTLRTRLGWETASYRGLTFLLEFEDISVIGDERYNDTVNGLNRPREGDRADTEINRMQIGYAFSAEQRVILGRQSFDLDNVRLLGSDGWRQNGRSIDMIRFEHDAAGPFKLTALWIENVNQAGGPNHPNPLSADTRLDGQVLHAQSQTWRSVTLSLIATFYDFTYLPEQSHRNLGFYARGQWPENSDRAWTYEASYIRQDDHADGAAVIDADYTEATLGYRLGAWHLTANREQLGGDGTYAFQTPLGRRHGPNGWADIFTNTPVDGLIDQNISLRFAQDGWTAQVTYHRFEADASSADYGDEWNLRLRRQLTDRLQASIDIADYQSDGYAVDTRKIWLYLYFRW